MKYMETEDIDDHEFLWARLNSFFYWSYSRNLQITVPDLDVTSWLQLLEAAPKHVDTYFVKFESLLQWEVRYQWYFEFYATIKH